MKKIVLFLITGVMACVYASVGWAATVGVGTGTGVAQGDLPIRSDRAYNYTQQIITKAQINTLGSIEKIRFYYSSGGTTNSSSWDIYMGHTNRTAFASNTSWIITSKMTRVFTGTVTFPGSAGWMEITLTTPFNYNNVDNLVVAVDENTAGSAESRALWGSYDSNVANSGIRRNSNSNINPASPGTASGRTDILNRIQLEINTSYSVSPSDVTRVLHSNTTKTQTLTITNNGASNLTITGITDTPNVTWVTYTPTTGTILPGASMVVTLTLDATGMAAGTNNTVLSIATSAGTMAVPVRMQVTTSAVPTNPRATAQFEEARGALIAYAERPGAGYTGWAIPDSLIVALVDDDELFVVVESGARLSTAQNSMQSILNTFGIGGRYSAVTWITAPTDSYWARDWGTSVSIYEDGPAGRRYAIVDFNYVRQSRGNDDDINIAIANQLGVPLYSMPFWHTGGNVMTDGLLPSRVMIDEYCYLQNDGDVDTGAMTDFDTSTEIPYTMTEFKDVAEMYRGYFDEGYPRMFPDPTGEYIHHIDTWAKLVAVDKVVISDGMGGTTETNLDNIATQWASWPAPGSKANYTVYRLNCPHNEPYSNAYILNDEVYIPFMGAWNGAGWAHTSPPSAADLAAKAVYESAMPGYTVRGFYSRNTTTAWVPTDALHCRTNTIYKTDEPVLPVELSSFTVTINAGNYAMLTWVTQTETGVAGFNIYRGTTDVLADATQLNSFIDATNTSQQQTYVYVDEEVWQDGTYYYWLESRDLDGTNNFYGPVSITLTQNGGNTPPVQLVTGISGVFPNPFSASATIAYSLSEKAERVEIAVYNVKGQLVRTLLQEAKEAGNYRLQWNGQDNNGSVCSSGLYNVVMRAGKERFNRKAILLK